MAGAPGRAAAPVSASGRRRCAALQSARSSRSGFGAVMLCAARRPRCRPVLRRVISWRSRCSLDNASAFLADPDLVRIPEAQRHRLLTWGIVAGARPAWRVHRGSARPRCTTRPAFVLHPSPRCCVEGWPTYQHRRTTARGRPRSSSGSRRARPRCRSGTAAVAASVIADIVFAIDSVPSILAITDDAFIVFAANAFALLGLAPLFFLVAHLVERLYYLKTALAALLVFIGIKMRRASCRASSGRRSRCRRSRSCSGRGRGVAAARPAAARDAQPSPA